MSNHPTHGDNNDFLAGAANSPDAMEKVRDAVLNLRADAEKWDEDLDGDTDSNGRAVSYCFYNIRISESSLRELVEAVGIKVGWNRSAGEALDEYLEAESAPTLETK
jgi:hypothetical protein